MAIIKGLDKAFKELNRLANESKQAMRRAEKIIAEDIVNDAIANAPEDKKMLIASIGLEQTADETTVFVGADYAAYQEFGTGPLVEIPKGLEAYAKEFYITGKGTTPAHPFFFPAVFKNTDRLEEVLNEELQNLSK